MSFDRLTLIRLSLFTLLASLMITLPNRSEGSLADRLADQAAFRQAIRSMDILDRPNRTIHFYGNMVRRRYEAGQSLFYERAR